MREIVVYWVTSETVTRMTSGEYRCPTSLLATATKMETMHTSHKMPSHTERIK